MAKRPRSKKLWLPFSFAVLIIAVEVLTPKAADLIGSTRSPLEIQSWSNHLAFISLIVMLHWYWILFETTREEVDGALEEGRNELLRQNHAILDRMIAGARLITIPRSDLYTSLLSLAERFERRAWNCWFNTRPPKPGSKVDREGYFKKLLERAKESDDSELRRIVLASRDNLPWVAELAGLYESLPHVSLAVFAHKEHPLSVQIFDHDRAIVVNPNQIGDIHDVLIVDNCGVAILQRYYEELWERSTIIVDRGTLRDEELQSLLMEHSSRARA
jgi:hypothetical protein